MLLAVNVGNTNTVIGIYRGGDMLAHWRIETRKERTADEYAVLLQGLFALAHLPAQPIDEAIIASVVPPAIQPIECVCREKLGVKAPLVVGPGCKTGMPILVDNPAEVGADRIVNAVAAYQQVKGGCIVVDFGTATTFDAVSPTGEYLGGAIAPGINISADALYARAAKLPRVEVRPASVVGATSEPPRQPVSSLATSGWSTVSWTGCARNWASRRASSPPAAWRPCSRRNRRLLKFSMRC